MNHTSRTFVWALLATTLGVIHPAWAHDISPTEPNEQPAQLAQPQPADAQPEPKPTLLLVEQQDHPRITIAWTAQGQRQEYALVVPYTAPVGGDPLGDSNALAYATMGGTRLETGAGHPRGAIVRVGLTKADPNRAFFKGIDPGTEIEIAISGVHFNQPVKYHQGTALMHLKYGQGDLKACALPGAANNQYLLSDPNDTLGGRVNPGVNATPGALDGAPKHGVVEIDIDSADPSRVEVHARLPYALLRHLQDPWVSELPGTFFEPIHFHLEAEFIPIDAEPLRRAPIVPDPKD